MDVLDRDRGARQHARAPAKSGRERDLGVALLQDRGADQVVERAVESAAPVEQRFRSADHARKLRPKGRPRLGDRRAHLWIGADRVGKKRDQPVAIVLDLHALDVEVEARDELAVAARRDQQRLADPHRLGQRVVGVRGENHVDAGNARGELAVDVEAVVRQQHHELRALPARLADARAHLLLADAKTPFRDHPARIGDRRVGKGLAEDRDACPGLVENLVGGKHRLLPFGVANVERQERIAELFRQLLHPLLAVGELPMARHGVGLQQLDAVDHVLALGAQRAERALPRVAAVEKQHAVLSAPGSHRLDHGCGAVEPADAAVASGEGSKIVGRERVGRGRTRRNAELAQEIAAAQMRRQSPRLADADIGGRLAQIDRHELAVQVGHVQERDIADAVEAQELALGEPLLRRDAAERPKPVRRRHRRRGNAHLDELAARDHQRMFPRSGYRFADKNMRHSVSLMPDARHAQLLPGIDPGEIELEIAVLLGIRRKLVRPDRSLRLVRQVGKWSSCPFCSPSHWPRIHLSPPRAGSWQSRQEKSRAPILTSTRARPRS